MIKEECIEEKTEELNRPLDTEDTHTETDDDTPMEVRFCPSSRVNVPYLSWHVKQKGTLVIQVPICNKIQ